MARSRILVTGVSGFVGGALGAHLRHSGHHVVGVSRSAPREGAATAFAPFDLTRTIPDNAWPGVDAIVHCAALASPWAHPAAYRANNVEATRNLLDWAHRTKAGHFVFISSSSVHYIAGTDQTGITEDTPLPDNAVNDYAATKRQAEDLVRQSGIPSVILRPRAVFGPGDTVLFPRILRAAERGALPRIVRPDGKSPLSDLIYIESLSHLIEQALTRGARGTLNLTNNEPVELYPFLDDLLDRLRLPRPRRAVRVGTAMSLARAAEVASRFLFNYKEPPVTRFGVEVMAYSKTFDVTRMLSALGPPPVSIETGVKRFLKWQQR